jgi:urease accessory protein
VREAADVLPALLQLASAALPIGGFGYSSGLEAAVESGAVRDADDAQRWVDAMLGTVWARGEARHWIALHAAFERRDLDAFVALNARALAMRETAELRLEAEQTGRSLALWLLNLAPPALWVDAARLLQRLRPIAHVAAHAAASAALALPARAALQALGWSLAENLALAAVKLVPLGQDAGQRLLHAAARGLPRHVEAAFASEDAPENFAPMLTLLSSAHETQYSRLFRS